MNRNSTLGILAVGTILAPFTGGGSLLYAAGSLGAMAAVESCTGESLEPETTVEEQPVNSKLTTGHDS